MFLLLFFDTTGIVKSRKSNKRLRLQVNYLSYKSFVQIFLIPILALWTWCHIFYFEVQAPYTPSYSPILVNVPYNVTYKLEMYPNEPNCLQYLGIVNLNPLTFILFFFIKRIYIIPFYLGIF